MIDTKPIAPKPVVPNPLANSSPRWTDADRTAMTTAYNALTPKEQSTYKSAYTSLGPLGTKSLMGTSDYAPVATIWDGTKFTTNPNLATWNTNKAATNASNVAANNASLAGALTTAGLTQEQYDSASHIKDIAEKNSWLYDTYGAKMPSYSTNTGTIQGYAPWVNPLKSTSEGSVGGAGNMTNGQTVAPWGAANLPPGTAGAPTPGMPSPVLAPGAPGSPMASAATTGLLYPGVAANGAYIRAVTPDELASYQLEKLTGSDSAMKQRATTEGMQYANSRGLLNGGLAGEAAFGAWVDRAAPIATADAATYGNAATENYTALNSFGLADKNNAFDMALQDDQQGWSSGENVLDRELTQSEGVLNRANDLEIENLGNASDLALQNSQNTWASGEGVLNREAAATEAQLDRDFTSSENQIGRDFTAGENELTREFDRETQMTAAEIEADAKLTQHLYDLEKIGYTFDLDKYNISKTYAANIIGNLQTSIAAILADPNLDQAAKDGAINNLITTTNDMLEFGSNLYSTDLPGFGSTTPTTPPLTTLPYGVTIPTAPAPATAPAPISPPAPNPTTTTQTVTGIFQKLMGRMPTAEGAAYWSGVMTQNGLTPEQLEAEMMKSSGYLDYVGGNA